MKHQNLRIALLAVLHILACVWLLWHLMPRPEGNEIVVEGIPVSKLFSSSRSTDAGVVVNGLTLGCGASAVAGSYSCVKQFDDGIVARVTYFKMTTVQVLLGFTDPALILLKIEQSGHIKYSKNYDDLREQYFVSGTLIPIFLFGISFLWLKKKLLIKKGVK